MADIIPFSGVHYDTSRVQDLRSVIAPPYDVISPQEQDALYAESPLNVVRIILNRAGRSDTAQSDRYARAGAALRAWLAEGVLVEDPGPALYLYEQEFTDPSDGARRVRTGLFCALKLEPYAAGVVLPHEETRPRAKEDRLLLMRALGANPEPIFALYQDADGEVAGLARGAVGAAPMLSAEIQGDTHRVWRLATAEAIDAIQSFLRGKRVWIADGHHRYETALSYAEEAARAGAAGVGPRYIMVVLTAFEDPGLVVLPTHRLVRGVSPARLADLDGLLPQDFDVAPASPDTLPRRLAAAAPGGHCFGLVRADGGAVLTLRDQRAMAGALGAHSQVWGELDVSILQALVLDRCLGIPEGAVAASADIAYTRDASEAVARVRSGEYQLGFLLSRPAPDEVLRVAAAGDRMPAKSTFFYPKLWSGLLMRRL